MDKETSMSISLVLLTTVLGVCAIMFFNSYFARTPQEMQTHILKLCEREARSHMSVEDMLSIRATCK